VQYLILVYGSGYAGSIGTREFMMIKALGSLMFLCSCTTSLTIVNSQGKATDMVDEDQAPATTVSPNVSLVPK
jgi:hypothetical protein